MDGRPLVEIRGLKKHYWLDGQEIPVLKGVDLDIRAKERISIIGPSGSGKSTFLHVLGTLDLPTTGIVKFEGNNIFASTAADLAAFRNRTIGFVFQFHHLLPEFSALENVSMPALIQRMGQGEAEDRAMAILRTVGLAHRVQHRPGELSGGEQQRVAIARALVLSPRLLLADEPTGNLDEASASGIHDLLDMMNDELGLTIVLVTHSSALASRMPRKLLMQDGRLVPAADGNAPSPTLENDTGDHFALTLPPGWTLSSRENSGLQLSYGYTERGTGAGLNVTVNVFKDAPQTDPKRKELVERMLRHRRAAIEKLGDGKAEIGEPKLISEADVLRASFVARDLKSQRVLFVFAQASLTRLVTATYHVDERETGQDAAQSRAAELLKNLRVH
jgi:lipoprotein-releasing system ATP-binding protein